LEPFVPLRVAWRGRGELYTLTKIEEANRSALLPPRQLANALYINELMMRLTERNEALPGLFAGYCRVLHALTQAQDVEPPLRLFEHDMLDELGLTLPLEHDSTGEPIVADARYRYDPETGPVRTHGSAQGELVSGHSLLAFAARDLSEAQTRREAKRVTRLAIERQLNGRPLHSRSLYRGPSTPSM
jgi:DNA repair protein RecO (recombination protein O)